MIVRKKKFEESFRDSSLLVPSNGIGIRKIVGQNLNFHRGHLPPEPGKEGSTKLHVSGLVTTKDSVYIYTMKRCNKLVIDTRVGKMSKMHASQGKPDIRCSDKLCGCFHPYIAIDHAIQHSLPAQARATSR